MLIPEDSGSAVQARKHEESSERMEAISLETWDQKTVADVTIVGCGPAGLALAAEVASRGINVVLIGECYFDRSEMMFFDQEMTPHL